MANLPKLVRDRIPETIINGGSTPITRTLEEVEYKTELLKKLQEEVNEVLSAEESEHMLEELADVLEVVKAIAELNGADLETIETKRKEKVKERGGFEKRIFLEEIRKEKV